MEIDITGAGLNSFKKNVYSQHGEDGVIERILDLLKIEKGYCVEFGAWDGRFLSNTFRLIEAFGWRGLMIEANAKRFEELTTNMAPYPVDCVKRWVDFEGKNSLDNILRECSAPIDFDLLSIDIDGNDYHVLDALKIYRPKIIVIEFNNSMPNDVEFVQPRDWSVAQGSSPRSILSLARSKGYRLCAATLGNLFLVRDDLFGMLAIEEPSLEEVRVDRHFFTTVFQLYDGTLVFQGCKRLLWHNVFFEDRELQVVPSALRVAPTHAGRFRRGLQRVWRAVRELRRRNFDSR